MPRGNPQNMTNAGKGRKLGSKNKETGFKTACLKVYKTIGGDKAFAAWAKKNKTEYYKMMSKLLPKPVEISTPEDSGLICGVVMLPAAEEEPEAEGG